MSSRLSAVAVAQSIERPFKGLAMRCNSMTDEGLNPDTVVGKILAAPSMGEVGNKYFSIWEVEQKISSRLSLN